eukprot:gene44547-55426_t
MANFDPTFLALRGNAQELAAVAKDFKIYYKKVDGKTPTSYTMDHSAGSYVYDTAGRLRVYHRYGSGAAALVADVATLLKESNQRIGGKQFRLNIKTEKDWFAASGQLQVDENQVMDLRALLEMMQANKSRFVELGNNQYLALTEELHRRLHELQAYGDISADGIHIHPLAAFALEDLAAEAGQVDADPAWRDHLKRMQASTAFTPQLPSTLQAELRDYQRDGYDWLARLAHWGVGACLADDMGLGKTLQALALILSRAPQGPALVIAPTSVCLNWVSEAARFAPTLNVKVFGSGDRAAMVDGAGAFDLVVCSYGLLQQEAERFADKQWHTIVLDEAQAIKNGATKRSQAVMALKGDFRMVATGTPLENHLGELWNLFRFINPGLLQQEAERFADKQWHTIVLDE